MKFARRIGVYFGVGVAQRLSSILVVPIYAAALDADGFGLLSLLLALELALVVLIDGGASGGILRGYFLVRKPQAPAFGAFSRRASALRSAMLGLVALLVMLAVTRVVAVDARLTVSVMAITVFIAFSQAMFAQAEVYYRNAGSLKAYGALSMLKIVGLPLACGVLVLIDRISFETIVYARLAIFAAIAAWLAFEIRSGRTGGRRRYLKTHYRNAITRFGYPAIPTRVVGWIRMQGGKAILALSVSLAEIGVYTTAMLPNQGVALVAMAMEQSLDPIYYRAVRDGRAENMAMLRRLGEVILIVLTAACAAAQLVSPYFFRLLFPEYLHDAAFFAPILLVFTLVTGMQPTLMRILTSHDMPWLVSRNMVISGVLVVGLLFAGSLVAGLAGACVGGLLGVMITYAIYYAACRRIDGEASYPSLGWAGFAMLTLVPGFMALANHRIGSDAVTYAGEAIDLVIIAACLFALKIKASAPFRGFLNRMATD